VFSPAARAAVVITLCMFAGHCRQSDPAKPADDQSPPPAAGARPLQPRLTGFPVWQPCREIASPMRLVAISRCGDPPTTPVPVSTPGEDCDEMTKSHSAALRTLVSRPHCTDAVVESLEGMATTGASASVLNDLAASYYVRAQRNDQPPDLVRALDAVQRAVAADPRLPAARFNLALMQEAFGLTREAVASWDEFARADHSPWATEAIEHRKRLANELANAAAIQWPSNRRQLAAIDPADRAAIAQSIAPYTAAAQRYVEEELLPEWAKNPKTPEAERALNLAQAIAEALWRQTNDPYLRDVVGTIRRAEGDRAKVTTLREAHIAFAEARAKQRAFEPIAAAAFYERAERLFTNAGSPVQGEATVGRVTSSSFKEGAADGLPLLDPVEQEASRRGYASLLASVYYIRGYFLMYSNRFVESIAQYNDAIAIDQRIHDEEGLANAHARKIGLFRTMGRNDLGWSEMVLAHRYSPRLVGVAPRHSLLGESAGLATASGYPQIALIDQNDAVRMIQDALANTPSDDAETIAGLQKNLAIALRARAGVEVHIDDYQGAVRDVDEAMRLLTAPATSADEAMRNTLLARIEEVKGRSLRTDPDRAVEAFSHALSLALPNEFRTLRATILAERADAHRRAGRKEVAKRDLEASLREIRAEESSILENRAAGTGEDLWSGYFARFRPTYEELIRQLVAEGQPAEAFAYWERALAFEPLNLVRKQQLPNDFRRFLGRGEMVRLPRIQAALPAGTILISFTVMNDQTLVWIVSHDRFQLLTLPLSAQRIDGWTKALQRAERHHDAAAFEAALAEPSASLMGPTLATIRTLAAGGTGPRLVFIPDRSIHALPLTALRDPATKRRVIEDAPVAIAGSSTLYIFSLMRDRDLKSDETPRALLVGDPAFDRQLPESHGLDRLPLARREVDRIGELYGPQAEVRVEGDATVPDFLERAQRSAVVHLAGHAIANPDAPSHSLLLLAPSPLQNGALTVNELLTNLRLQKTRLFVLSACSSAGGVPIGPEGLAPLVRPLIAAGVPGVIGTLWNVQDGTAEELMVGFHRHYREGHDAAVALQLAQLELMRSPKPGLRSVRAWASFQVIGYASSPFPSLTKSGRRDLQ